MRLALFASGGGSNAQAILDAIRRGELRAEPVLLVSNKPGARALARARDAGIATATLRDADDAREILAALREADADFVALAGYLKRIPREVVVAFSGRIVNIHPSLLPAFGGAGMYGRRVHEAVLASGAKESGATVHLVDDDYDTGPIVMQRAVPVELADTPETLAARVLKAEHALYPEALRLFME